MPPSTRSNSKPTRRRQQRSSATRPAQLPEPALQNFFTFSSVLIIWAPVTWPQNSTMSEILNVPKNTEGLPAGAKIPQLENFSCTAPQVQCTSIEFLWLNFMPDRIVEVLLRMQPSKSVDSMKFYLTDQHYYYFFKTQFAWQSTFWNVRFLVV